MSLSEVGCFNDSKMDKVPLLLLSVVAILEDVKG
jgi:hypothetical protein